MDVAAEFKNTKNVPYYIFGDGSFNNLAALLVPRRAEGIVVFCVDHFFDGHARADALPVEDGDQVCFVDVTDEPTTTDIDALRDAVDDRRVGCVVGMGGGATLDVAKALSNLLTNGGHAADYQGWDLVKVPGIYKIGVPTLSGTGSESSRTCVLTNVARGIKLGMNSDFTMFDQLVLDPSLLETVPRDQFFYSGMDTFFHCMESLRGSYRNVIVDAYATMAIELCRRIFLADDMHSKENRERLMLASYLGGCSAGNVGVVHPISAGLSVVLHSHHGVANCHAMSVLEEFYPEEHREFNAMLLKQGVRLREGLCRGLAETEYEQLVASSLVHDKPLTNALGAGFRQILTREKLIEMFKRM